MTAPLQYGTQPAGDPTAVMGRRTLAWIADLLLYAAVVAAGIASMVEYVDIPPGIAAEDACAELERQTGELPNGCFAVEDRLYLLDESESALQTGLSLGWFALFVILQGVTGGSPGKLLFGLRVVDQYGTRIGIGKSLGRTLMWVVDAAPWIIPLVGPVAAFTSSGHRRVGDLAAGTYVVSSSSVGQPVMPDNAPIPAGQQPWGAAAPTTPPTAPHGWQSPSAPPPHGPGPQAGGDGGRWSPPAGDPTPDLDFGTEAVPTSGERADEVPPALAADPEWSRTPDLEVTPPPAVQELDDRAAEGAGAASGWEPPSLPEVEDPSATWQPPTTPTDDWADAPEQQSPTPPAAPFAAPGAEGPPPAADAAVPGPPPTPRYELPPPQWDPARGTYLQWEPNRQAWLQWDTAAERWKPIDT